MKFILRSLSRLYPVLVTVGMLLMPLGSQARPLIIAHRGASAECPENTLASARKAWEHNADAVEIDVFASADGEAVVIHDANTSRTTGHDLVVTATSSLILRQLDAGSWKGAEFAGERIPLLREVMATVPRGKTLFIELKGDLSTIPPVVKVLRDTRTTQSVVVISFNFEMLKTMKAHFPEIPMYWLRGTRQDPTTKKPLPHPTEWLGEVQKGGLDGINVHYQGVTPEFVAEAKRRKLPVYAWTVNTTTEALRLAKLGVAGITTDRPKELLALFDRNGR